MSESMGVSIGESMVVNTEYELSDPEWECLERILPPDHNFGRGRPVAETTRTKINGMLWIARTQSNWRDLPECYGNWQTVYSTSVSGVKTVCSRSYVPGSPKNPKWQVSAKT